MPVSVVLDTNLIVSFLLSPSGRHGTVVRVIRTVLGEGFTWVVPFEQLLEFENQRRKRKLASRLSGDRWDDLTNLARDVAQIIPKQERPFPKIARDSNDDYLIAIAIWEGVDILVSGDKDLLVLRGLLEQPRIMPPADFIAEFGPSN